VNHASDWLQLTAGVCAAVGFVLLSVGLIGNPKEVDPEESGAKYIRPVLTGIGVAVVAALLSHYAISTGHYMSSVLQGIGLFGLDASSSRSLDPLFVTGGVIIGFLLGYWLGFKFVQNQRRQRQAKQLLRVFFATALLTIMLIGLTVFVESPLQFYRLPELIAAAGAVLLSIELVLYSVAATPRSLKLLGFFITLLGIYLAILPALLSLLGIQFSASVLL
jgi:hypothetical protein